MRYCTIVFALLVFASCETKTTYRCDCSSNQGRILYTYDAELKQAPDGEPGCQAAEDSLVAIKPNDGVRCYFYNISN